eukprot:Awhi_evm1s14781
MFQMIQECYRGTISSVLVYGSDSKVFGIRGLHLDLEDDEINHMIQCLLHADDGILLAKNIEDVKD